jgi:hypothetical protein
MGKDEKPEEFSSRMLDLILGDPDSYFCRVPVTRGRVHFREAERLIWHGARILTGETPLPYVWRNVGRHCRFLCSYRELCIEETPNMTSRLFEVREKPHEELSLAEA